MKILFVVDRVNDQSDANINLMKSILPFLEQENEVYFLGHDTDKQKCINNDFCFHYKLDDDVRNLYFTLGTLQTSRKILKLLSNPLLSFFAIFKVLKIDLISFKYQKHIKQVVKKYNIDIVISISAPFYTTKAVSRLHSNIKKIAYMLDPYADHYIFKSARALKIEKTTIKRMDKVITTKLLEHEYKKRYGNKSVALEFPSLTFNSQAVKENPYDKTKINLAYVGSLYADIRSPEYLYDLISKAANPDIHLTIVGGVYGEFTKEFHDKYKTLIENQVTFIGKIPKEETAKYIQFADVLVNLGNNVANMLPSKVIELIATGKPVLNLMQIDSCPSKLYFDRYNNNLDLLSKKDIDNKVLSEFHTFLSCKKYVSQKAIEEAFYSSTPQFVAWEITNILNNL